ncbi:MAG: TolC family protein [Candidatus Caenarcaniphilales bacterium]|nr:TolC family protein [Candidatus Caenarcaniphilales bacterium]
MQSVYLALFFLLWSLFNHPAYTLTYEEAVKLAITNNKSLKAKLALLPVAEAEMIIAKYRPNPSLASAHELVRGGAIQPVQIALPIEIGKKRFYRKELAKKEIEKTKLEIEKEVWQTQIELRGLYSKSLVSKELVELFKDKQEKLQGDSGKENGDQIELLVNANLIDEYEITLNSVNLSLKELLNVDIDQNLNLEDDLQDVVSTYHQKLSEINSLETIIDKRFDTLILGHEQGIQSSLIKSYKAQRIPDLVLETGVSHLSLGDPFWGMYLGGGFEIPIFDRKQGEIKKAEAQLDLVKLEKDSLRSHIGFEIEKAIFNFKARDKQLARLSKLLDLSAVDLSFQEEYLKAKLNMWLAVQELEFALGMVL